MKITRFALAAVLWIGLLEAMQAGPSQPAVTNERIAELTRQMIGPVRNTELTSEMHPPASSQSPQKDPPEVIRKRWQAALELGAMGESSVPALIPLLNHTNALVRIAAQNALRDMKADARPALPELVANLKHENWAVRRTALIAIGEIDPAAIEVVPDLIKQARDDENFENRGIAIWIIQGIAKEAVKRFPDIVEELASFLDDEERMLRLNAARALGAMGAPAAKAIPKLILALKHPDQYTRLYAAQAIGSIGVTDAAVEPLKAALVSIAGDTRGRQTIKAIIERFTGQPVEAPPEPSRTGKTRSWCGLQRKDFFLACQPLLTQNRDVDQDTLLKAFVDEEMCNAFCFWPDHTWFSIPTPTWDQMQEWGLAAIWYFFTEDIYNPKMQREWGFKTLEEYNLDVTERILAMTDALGKERCLWSVGHEHFDSGGDWGEKKFGVPQPIPVSNKKEGYAFYKKWITTDIHKNHWNSDYGNNRPLKFFMGWDTGAPATWNFLKQHNLDVSKMSLMSGGVSAVLAHAAFEILPRIGCYWWECQINGNSLQIGSAYIRGACRQFKRKWLLDASPWSPVFGGMRFNDKGENTGGVTDNQQLRTWVYGYLAGADCVFEEASNKTHFFKPDNDPKKIAMTSTGKIAKEVADFCFRRCPERGTPFTPVGIILEKEHGYDPSPHSSIRGKGPWMVLNRGPGEWEIERFWQTVYPDHSAFPKESFKKQYPVREAKEPLCLHGSDFPDLFSVFTEECPVETLKSYPRLMTLGGIVLSDDLFDKLKDCVHESGEVMLNITHIPEKRLNDECLNMKSKGWKKGRFNDNSFRLMEVETGKGEVLLRDDEGSPVLVALKHGQGRFIISLADHNLGGYPIGEQPEYLPQLRAFLKQWVMTVCPITVSKKSVHDIQIALNVIPDGWLVIAGNHYPEPWQGTIELGLKARTKTCFVRELWEEQESRFAVKNDGVSIAVEIPKYAYRVYRIRTDGRNEHQR